MKKLLLFILLLLVIALNTGAQQQNEPKDSITVLPAKVDMKIAAGDAYENDYSITNNYNGPLTVEITLDNWYSYEANASFGVNDWVTVEPKEIKLQAGETGIAHYKVQTSTAMVGSIGAKVIFTARPPHQEMFKIRLTTFLYAQMTGTEKIDFEILGAKFGKSGDFILGHIIVKNKGNAHIRPMGAYIMKGPATTYKGNISQEVPVYAGTTRSDWELVVPKGLNMAPGKYRFDLSAKVGNKAVKKTVWMRINKDGSIENL